MSSESTSSLDLEQDISQLRTAYSRTTFTEDQLVSSTDPFQQFHAWFQDALSCEEITEANAVCVSTVDKDGRPSSRMVLMKGYSKEEGFKFYTNLESRKAREMAGNPEVCLLFYWPPLHRQVRIEGMAEHIGEEAAAQYFSTRPRQSQLSAVVSHQSTRISSRKDLEERHRELAQVYSDPTVDIPKPEHWGGYRVKPRCVEFWQGQSTRLHDRIVFERGTDDAESDSWTVHRLAP